MNRLFTLLLVNSIILTGCGGGGSSTETSNSTKLPTTDPSSTNTTPSTPEASTSKTLTVVPSLGKVLNAKVTLRNAITNELLGEQNTNTTGKVVFTVPKSISTVVVELKGGLSASYFDEATEKMVNLPEDTSLRAVTTLINTNSEVAITALTEAVFKRAETLAKGGNVLSYITQAKTEIETIFSVPDVLQTPTLVSDLKDLANLETKAADQYALKLAVLARIAHKRLGVTETAPALKISKALITDLKDGDLDGSDLSGSVLPYELSQFANDYEQESKNLINYLSSNASLLGFDAAKLNAQLNYLQNNPAILKVNAPAPFTLKSVDPTNVTINSIIRILGTGFNPDKTQMKVIFSDNSLAEILSSTPTELMIQVPNHPVTGKIQVTNIAQNLTLMLNDTVSVTPGIIRHQVNSLSPTIANVGDLITLSGEGFNPDKNKMSVFFANDIQGETISATETKIVVKVPQHAVSGQINVFDQALDSFMRAPNITISQPICANDIKLTTNELESFKGTYLVDIEQNPLDVPLNSPISFVAKEFKIDVNKTYAGLYNDNMYYGFYAVCQSSTDNHFYGYIKSGKRIDFSNVNNKQIISGKDFPKVGDSFISVEGININKTCKGEVKADVNRVNKTVTLSWPTGGIYIMDVFVSQKSPTPNSSSGITFLRNVKDSINLTLNSEDIFDFTVKLRFDYTTSCDFPTIRVNGSN